MFRMDVYAFRALCELLRADAALYDSTQKVSVEEALAMFCFTIGHGVVKRTIGDRFQHSETITRHVYAVMQALCRLARRVIAPTHMIGITPYIQRSLRHYMWFEVTVFSVR